MEKPRYVVHLRTSGYIATGKTSLMLRWLQDTFSAVELVTIGGESHEKIVDVGGHRVKVELLDTGGQEKFRYNMPPPDFLSILMEKRNHLLSLGPAPRHNPSCLALSNRWCCCKPDRSPAASTEGRTG
jgi:GTPase SAR1 family protein